MITVDKRAGLAQDHGELWLPDAEEAIRVIVELAIEDDGQFSVGYSAVGGDTNYLYFPIERLKALLKG